MKQPENTQELIALYYRLEIAALVSPHSLRKRIGEGDTGFILIDLRSNEEFRQGRIRGARSIPAYRDPDTPAVDEKRIVQAFKDLPTQKEVIIYCYSKPCMTGRKVGDLLARSDIFVKHLGIGWNEWRHEWASWNHEHELPHVSVLDYIETEQDKASAPPLGFLCEC